MCSVRVTVFICWYFLGVKRTLSTPTSKFKILLSPFSLLVVKFSILGYQTNRHLVPLTGRLLHGSECSFKTLIQIPLGHIITKIVSTSEGVRFYYCNPCVDVLGSCYSLYLFIKLIMYCTVDRFFIVGICLCREFDIDGCR